MIFLDMQYLLGSENSVFAAYMAIINYFLPSE